ncbi:MAG: hypothetical protein KDC34_03380 [Saprospiraceae bacterium]|nr:hypothetical protein [Saprospiraceae bacterium]
MHSDDLKATIQRESLLEMLCADLDLLAAIIHLAYGSSVAQNVSLSLSEMQISLRDILTELEGVISDQKLRSEDVADKALFILEKLEKSSTDKDSFLIQKQGWIFSRLQNKFKIEPISAASLRKVFSEEVADALLPEQTDQELRYMLQLSLKSTEESLTSFNHFMETMANALTGWSNQITDGYSNPFEPDVSLIEQRLLEIAVYFTACREIMDTYRTEIAALGDKVSGNIRNILTLEGHRTQNIMLMDALRQKLYEKGSHSVPSKMLPE